MPGQGRANQARHHNESEGGKGPDRLSDLDQKDELNRGDNEEEDVENGSILADSRDNAFLASIPVRPTGCV